MLVSRFVCLLFQNQFGQSVCLYVCLLARSLLSKSLVTLKLLHLEYFVKICCSATFESAIT